jgi:radical SAM-linked protein
MEKYRLRVFYRKEGISRFISHLSFCKIIERTLRRLDIPLIFSEGFTPHPKISFCPPLPIPLIGINEFFEVEVKKKFNINLFIEMANRILPEGVEFKNCFWVKDKFSLSKVYGIYYIPKNEKVLREDIEKNGKILEEGENFIKVIFKMENFNHRKVFKNGLFDGIKRELFIKEDG